MFGVGRFLIFFFFFFNDTATTEIYTLSLHDALPICVVIELGPRLVDRFLDDDLPVQVGQHLPAPCLQDQDRKSTRLNSSHGYISYAVFCLKKKKKTVQKYSLTLVITYMH